MTFSNLDFVKNLRSTGLTIEQSEAISNGYASAREDMKHLSTKDDIKEVKEDFKVLKEDFKEIKSDFKALKEDFKEIKADFKEIQNDLDNFKNETRKEFKDLRKDINDWRNDLLNHFDRFQSKVENKLVSHCSVMFVTCTTAIIAAMTLLHTLN
jgi:predicted nuclease with TOPRIM domain